MATEEAEQPSTEQALDPASADAVPPPVEEPAEPVLTDLDKHLLKELKHGPKPPTDTADDESDANAASAASAVSSVPAAEDPLLWKKSMKKWIKTVKAMIDDGANINCQKSSNKQTPLIIVCSKKVPPANTFFYRMINFLLDYGADVTIRDKFGMTALHHASYSGNYYACQVLLDTLRQEDCLSDFIDSADAAQLTPLHEASCAEEAKICKLLIKWGAQTDLTDMQDRSALDLARQFERDKVVHVLTTKMEDWSDDENDDLNDPNDPNQTNTNNSNNSNNFDETAQSSQNVPKLGQSESDATEETSVNVKDSDAKNASNTSKNGSNSSKTAKNTKDSKDAKRDSKSSKNGSRRGKSRKNTDLDKNDKIPRLRAAGGSNEFGNDSNGSKNGKGRGPRTKSPSNRLKTGRANTMLDPTDFRKDGAASSRMVSSKQDKNNKKSKGSKQNKSSLGRNSVGSRASGGSGASGNNKNESKTSKRSKNAKEPKIDLKKRMSIGSDHSDDEAVATPGTGKMTRRERNKQRLREKAKNNNNSGGSEKKLKEQLVMRNKEIVELKNDFKQAKSELEKYKKQILKLKDEQNEMEMKKKEIISHYETRLKETKKYAGIKEEMDKKQSKVDAKKKAETTVPKAEFEALQKQLKELQERTSQEEHIFAKVMTEKDAVLNELQAKLDAQTLEIKELKEEQVILKKKHKEKVDSILSGYDGVRQALKERRESTPTTPGNNLFNANHVSNVSNGSNTSESDAKGSKGPKRRTSIKARSADANVNIAKKRMSNSTGSRGPKSGKSNKSGKNSKNGSIGSIGAKSDEMMESNQNGRKNSISGNNTKLFRKQQRFAKWLKEDVCLDKYLSKFVDGECNRLDIVKMMTDDDLKELGINKKFDRRLILTKVEEMKLQSEVSNVLSPMAKKLNAIKQASELNLDAGAASTTAIVEESIAD